MNSFHPIICDLIKLIRKGIGNLNNLVYSVLTKWQICSRRTW